MRKREEGIALIAVLWTLVLLSIVAASFSLETRTESRIARNMTDSAKCRAAADAGIRRAILDLVNSRYGRQLDKPLEFGKFRTDGTVYRWQFGDSIVLISIEDERGKVDLNKAPEALLSALFGSADAAAAAALADAVADFRDPDNFRRSHGAEEAEYRAAGIGWGPKNAPFESVEELQQVLGMTNTVYESVAPFLTVHSTYALGTGIDPSRADEKLKAILRDAGLASRFLIRSSGTVYSIRAEARGFNAADFVREAVVQIFPGSGTSARILEWKQGEQQRLVMSNEPDVPPMSMGSAGLLP